MFSITHLHTFYTSVPSNENLYIQHTKPQTLHTSTLVCSLDDYSVSQLGRLGILSLLLLLLFLVHIKLDRQLSNVSLGLLPCYNLQGSWG